MRIGEIARRTLCSVPTIRYYEALGLLPMADRSESGQRIFSQKDVVRLQFIRRARDFGMPIDLVRQLLAASVETKTACASARDIVRQQLSEIRSKRHELTRLEASLQMMAQRCDDSCGSGAEQPCTIFEDIGTANQ
ncbi:MAG: MerR family transcriptional regulator [Pseudomonadota bacterium]